MTARFAPLLYAAALCACSGPPTGGAGGTAEPPLTLAGTEWVLASLGGEPAVPRPAVTLAFQDSTAGGYGGCNWYGGGYSARADTLRFGEMSQTLRGCPEPAGGQEARFMGLLGGVRRFQASADTLVLLGGAGDALLRLVRRQLPAMDPAALPGTTWRLRHLDGVAPGSGARPTLSFHGDSLRGHGGCRPYTGSYHATGHRLSVTSLTMGDGECPGEPLLRLEGDFTTGLTGTTDFELRGDSLVLHTAGGGVLVFQKDPR